MTRKDPTSTTRKDAQRKSIQDAFAFAEAVVDGWDKFPDKFIAIPATSALTSTLFTAERRRLLQELKSHGTHDSVQSLAKCVHRDPTRVSRDLKPLIDVGLVRATPFGKSKKLSATNRPVLIR